jgi:hypothetical protein
MGNAADLSCGTIAAHLVNRYDDAHAFIMRMRCDFKKVALPERSVIWWVYEGRWQLNSTQHMRPAARAIVQKVEVRSLPDFLDLTFWKKYRLECRERIKVDPMELIVIAR